MRAIMLFMLIFIPPSFSYAQSSQDEKVLELVLQDIKKEVNNNPALALSIGAKFLEENNYKSGLHWILFAADKGNVSAQSILGNLYVTGKGVEQDYTEARRWYELALEGDDASAYYALALMEANGHGGPKNPDRAGKLNRKAAELGYPRAQFNIAMVSLSGIDAPVDLIEAYAWSSVAARSEPKAVKLRDLVAAKLDPVSLSRAQERASVYLKKYGVK